MIIEIRAYADDFYIDTDTDSREDLAFSCIGLSRLWARSDESVGRFITALDSVGLGVDDLTNRLVILDADKASKWFERAQKEGAAAG